ncbi:MAG: macro domain-containing protein [Acidobacteria bacterium]|nr:macro domain-containing protein [Acidobacteriota bacterium]
MPEMKKIRNCELRLIRQDITDFEIEAFVFYARPDLELGSGFGSAITRRGGPVIKKELDAVGSLSITEAAVTGAGQLKAEYIVHAVGPVFQEERTEEKLHATVLNALKKAEAKGIRRIAFPPMGTGFYGVPLAASRDIMIRAFEAYLSQGGKMEEIVICANDLREYRAFQGMFH